jgi:hypothetical protein
VRRPSSSLPRSDARVQMLCEIAETPVRQRHASPSVPDCCRRYLQPKYEIVRGLSVTRRNKQSLTEVPATKKNSQCRGSPDRIDGMHGKSRIQSLGLSLSTSYKSRPSPSAWTRVEADLLFFTQRCIERGEVLTHGFDSLM